MAQPDLFGPLPPKPPETVTAEDVRPELTALLEQLRAADTMPLSAKELRWWRTVAPQMSRWLGPEEQAEYLAAFWAEVERLETRRAA